MSVKTTYVCDRCKTEFTKEPDSDIEIEATYTYHIAIKVVKLPQMDKPHLCKYCVVDVITNALDDRPKQWEGR